MAIPTVYRSTDPGAPTFPRQRGAQIEVLRACLVDGYGSQAPAGWSEPYTDTYKAVFQNSASSGGTGFCLRVEDLNASFGSTSVTGYASMSDTDTGINPTFAEYFHNRQNNTTSATARNWILAATPTAFILSVESGASAYEVLMAGDLVDTMPGDAFRYYVGARRQSSTWTNPPSFLQATNFNSGGDAGIPGGWNAAATTNTGLSLASQHTGVTSAISAGLLSAPAWDTSSRYVGGTGYPTSPSENGFPRVILPAWVVHRGASSPIFRGRLPGIYLPLFNTAALAQDTLDAAVAGSGSSTRLFKFHQNVGVGGLLVETALDWG